MSKLKNYAGMPYIICYLKNFYGWHEKKVKKFIKIKMKGIKK